MVKRVNKPSDVTDAFYKAVESLNIKPIRAKGKILPVLRVGSISFGQSAFTKQLTDAIAKSNSIFADSVRKILDEAIRDPRWGDGGVYETGALMNSLEISTTAKQIQVNYTEPYAALQHYGGYILPYGNTNLSKVYIPGRPWVTTAFTENDLGSLYQQILLDNI